MSIRFARGSTQSVIRYAVLIATVGAPAAALSGCGDDAHEQGAGGTTSSSSTSDAATTSTATTSTTATSSSTGGMCMPGPTTDPWAPTGPYGGSIGNVITMGSNVVATINYSVFRSADNGQTWASIAFPTGADDFANFAKTSTDLFASGGYAVYRSTDAGLTWTDATLNLPTLSAGLNLTQLDGGVAVSDPSGTSPYYRWNATNQNWDALNSPADANEQIAATGMDVYVLSSAGSLYDSHAGGAFQLLPTPPGTFSMSAAGGALVVLDPLNHPYVSTNSGVSFTQASSSPIGSHLVPTATGFVSVGAQGVFTSKDFGATWQTEATGAPMYTTWDTADASGSTLFAAGYAGLYSRPSMGPTWSLVPLGVHEVGALAGDGTKLVASVEQTTSISSDGGATWHPSSINAAFDSLKMLKSGGFVGGGSGAQILRSLDGGQTWNPTTEPKLPKPPAQQIICAAFTETATSVLAATGGAGVYRSVDNGITWSNSNQGLPVAGQDMNGLSYYEALTSLASGTGFVYAGTVSMGIFVSTDDGATWLSASSGIPANGTGQLPLVVGLAVSENSVIAATHTGSGATQMEQVWRSNDHGASWTDVSAAFPTGVRIGSLAAQGELVYAGAGISNYFDQPVDGVYLSKDDGATWSQLVDGWQGAQGHQMLITPTNLFVGTNDRSIFKHPLCPSN